MCIRDSSATTPNWYVATGFQKWGMTSSMVAARLLTDLITCLLYTSLSRMMLSGANVLLLDQPTNHLDLESIAAVNNGLEAVKCNVLFSSHDHQMVQTVANRIFDFTADGRLIDRLMTYDEYLERVAQEAQG